jgi:uncharacterized membrane protein YgcG
MMPFSSDLRTDSSRAEILARCVDAVNSGKATIESCVARYPEFETLGELLSASQAVHKLPLVTLRTDAKNDIRERMLAKYRASQIQAPPIRKAVPGRIWKRAAVSIAASLVLLFGGGTALVGASDTALPGDTLYGLKRRIEQIELAFADRQAWPDLLYRNAQLRLTEIDTLAAHHQPLPNEVVNDVTQSVSMAIAFQPDQVKKTQLLGKTREILDRVEAQALLDPAAKSSALKLLPEPSATLTATTVPTSTLVPTTSLASVTATASATASNTPTATLTPSVTASPSPTPTLSPTPTITPSPTTTSTVEPTENPTKLGTATRTPQTRNTATRTIRQRTSVPGGSGQRPTQKPRPTQQQPTQGNSKPGQAAGGNPQNNGGNNGNNGNNGGNGGNGGGNGGGGGGNGNGGGNGGGNGK